MPLFTKKKEKKQPARIPYTQVDGFFNSNMDDEIEGRLANDAIYREFKKMADSDAICGAVLLCISKIFQSIEWKTINDEQKVLERSLINVNWFERLEEILSFLTYGFDVQEVVLKRDEDGMVVWDSMYNRPQDTILEWNQDDNGDLISITQQGIEGEGTVDIPINKCFHFANMKTRNNPRGKSIFRNAYRDWYYRTNIEKIEAISIERDGTGIPVLTPSDDDLLVDEKGAFTALGQWAWETVKNLKQNHQEGLVLPNKWEFKLQGSPGTGRFDLNKVIDRYDGKIALSMLSQFLILGVINGSGSFSLATTQSQIFFRAVEGFANLIVHTVNSQFIGGEALGLLNDIEPPQLAIAGIDQPSLDELASFLGRLFKFNILTPDDKLEAYLRDRAKLPDADPDTARKAEIVGKKKDDDDEDDNDTKKKLEEKEDKDE